VAHKIEDYLLILPVKNNAATATTPGNGISLLFYFSVFNFNLINIDKILMFIA
jgi:hypothetical protein